MTGPTPSLFQTPRASSSMLDAVETTIEAKRAAGVLTTEDAALVEMCRQLAITIEAGAPYGKTTVPNACQQLREALADLPKAAQDDASDSLAALMQGDAPAEAAQ